MANDIQTSIEGKTRMQLNKILSGFNKTLKQLDTFIKQQEFDIARNHRAKAQLEQDQIILQTNLTKATNVKKNIEGMIS